MHPQTSSVRWRRSIRRHTSSPVCTIKSSSTTSDSQFALGSGTPFPIQEYYAPCHVNGSLTLLFLPISRHSQNILHSPSHAASITLAAEHPRASRARVSLLGNVTILSDADESVSEIKSCYLAKHRDARGWLPADPGGAHIVRPACRLPGSCHPIAVPVADGPRCTVPLGAI
jgi:hypothetical protein